MSTAPVAVSRPKITQGKKGVVEPTSLKRPSASRDGKPSDQRRPLKRRRTTRATASNPPRSKRPNKQVGNPNYAKSSLPASSSKSAGFPPTNDASKLCQSKHVLDLLYTRNKNQHASQLWWSSLTLLRRALGKLIALDARLEQLTLPAPAAGTSAQQVRERFDRETQARRERELRAAHVRDALVPRAYVAFSGVVGDKQFANLGVVLVAALAEVAAQVGHPAPLARGDGLDGAGFKAGEARSLRAVSVRATGSERGAVVERSYDSDDVGEVVERVGGGQSGSDAAEALDTDVGKLGQAPKRTSPGDAERVANVDAAKGKNVSGPSTPSESKLESDTSTSRRKEASSQVAPKQDKQRKDGPQLSAKMASESKRAVAPLAEGAVKQPSTKDKGKSKDNNNNSNKKKKKTKNAIDAMFAGF